MNVKLNKISQDLLEAVKDSSKKGTEPYDTTAEVVRLDGNTAWVHISGGVDETPVRKTIDCKVNDIVQIRVGGGDAFIIGNVTSPPTDDTKVIEVEKKTDKIAKGVESIGAIAGNTNQYFWHTERGIDTGAHITEIPRDEFLKDPENGGFNALMRSIGFAIRYGLVEHSIFGFDHSRIGLPDGSHIEMKEDGFKVYDDGGSLVFEVSTTASPTVRNTEVTVDENSATVTTGSGGLKTVIWTLKNTPILSEKVYTAYFADGVEISGQFGIDFDEETTEQTFTYNSMGFKASIDGTALTLQQTSGTPIEGVLSVNYYYSWDGYAPAFSFGLPTRDNAGANSATFGDITQAPGECAFATGLGNIAEGDYSFVGGEGNTAQGWAQTVFGRFNQPMDDSYPFVVGNGQRASAKSNAMALDHGGTIHLNGTVYVGCNADSTGGRELGKQEELSGNGSGSSPSSTSLSKLAELCDITDGTWIINASVRFPANSTGTRACELGIGSSQYGASYVARSSVGNGVEAMETTLVVNVTGTKKVTLFARQNSGSNMTVTYYYKATRIN